MFSMREVTDIEVIFIHLGENLPDHLKLNLIRFKDIFFQISFIVAVDSNESIEWLRSQNINFIDYATLQVNEVDLYELHGLDKIFRDGFWFKTLKRLFVLCEVAEISSKKIFIHIESDVLLMPNFPWTKFLGLSKLSWPKVDLNQDVASIVVIPNVQQAISLRNLLLLELKKNPKHTDMSILSDISRNYPQLVETLPTSNKEFLELTNPKFREENEIECITSLSDYFEGIFDGLFCGVWLAGTDPKNTYGFTIIHNNKLILNSNSLIHFSDVSFHYSKNTGLRLGTRKAFIELYSLHVHSKNLALFSYSWENELIRLTNWPKLLKLYKFDLRLFFNLVMLNYQNKTLKSYLLNIKLFKVIRKLIRI